MSGHARHIMMTTDTVGSVWVYAMTLARALTACGDHVTLVTLGPQPRPRQRDEAKASALDLVVTDLALESMDPAGQDRERAAETLLELASSIRPDIVHLNSFREGALAWPAPALVVAHSCVMSWFRACRGALPDEPHWLAYAQAVDDGLRAADAWVSPTAAFAQVIEDLYQPPTPPIVIHNGVEAMPERASPGREVILASGRVWDAARNLAALVAAAPQIRWLIELAGPEIGPNGEITSRGGSSAVGLEELAPPHLLARMRDAAIYLAPSCYEPFGLGVLGAAAAGCALVLADIATFRELWEGAALFVDGGDRAALVRELNTLCVNEELRAGLAVAAQERARRYTVDATAEQYRTLYDTMLGVAGPAGVRREARA